MTDEAPLPDELDTQANRDFLDQVAEDLSNLDPEDITEDVVEQAMADRLTRNAAIGSTLLGGE